MNRNPVIQGLRDGTPIAMGYFAVAFSLGIIAVQAGLTAPMGFVSSFFTRASAGEYGTYTLIAAGAAWAEIVVMCLVVNLRYMLMSAALSQKIRPGTAWGHRLMMALCITDEVFGISVAYPGYTPPAYTYAATAPMPDGMDEYMLAGFIRSRRVELVRCLTVDLEVPADADFVIEGYIDPAEEPVWEGPFGDHTGFYSLPDWYPRFHVTCITHRRDAVYPATLVGVPPMEDAQIARATERIFLEPLRTAILPELVDMHMPDAGTAHNLALISLQTDAYEGVAYKAMNALWGAGQMMFNKILIAFNAEVQLTDYKALAHKAFSCVNPATDFHFGHGIADVLDHAPRTLGIGSKLLIDATGAEQFTLSAIDPEPISNAIAQAGGELSQSSRQLLQDGLPVAIAMFERNSTSPAMLHTLQALAQQPAMQQVVMLVAVDKGLPTQRLDLQAWWTLANIDPKRDMVIVPTTEGQRAKVLVDGTRKLPQSDQHTRPWPNPALMDAQTIAQIDALWPQLNIGAPIASPSAELHGLNCGNSAEAKLP